MEYESLKILKSDSDNPSIFFEYNGYERVRERISLEKSVVDIFFIVELPVFELQGLQMVCWLREHVHLGKI